jgi:hypothetical protein
MHDEITTTIREIRSLEAAIKKATRMREARKQKLIDRWNDLKDQHGLTLKVAARITGYPQHSLVNTFYGGQSPFFTPDRWTHFFNKLFSHVGKKQLATVEDEE